MVGCREGRLRQRHGQRRLRQDACCMLDKSDAYSHSVPQSIAPRRFDGLQINSSITSAVVSAPSWFEQDHAGRLNRLICERPRRSKRIFCLLTRGWVLPPVGPRDTAVSCLGPEGSPRIGAISGLRARRHGESIWLPIPSHQPLRRTCLRPFTPSTASGRSATQAAVTAGAL
jgi:hypothetical protein